MKDTHEALEEYKRNSVSLGPPTQKRVYQMIRRRAVEGVEDPKELQMTDKDPCGGDWPLPGEPLRSLQKYLNSTSIVLTQVLLV